MVTIKLLLQQHPFSTSPLSGMLHVVMRQFSGNMEAFLCASLCEDIILEQNNFSMFHLSTVYLDRSSSSVGMNLNSHTQELTYITDVRITMMALICQVQQKCKMVFPIDSTLPHNYRITFTVNTPKIQASFLKHCKNSFRLVIGDSGLV